MAELRSAGAGACAAGGDGEALLWSGAPSVARQRRWGRALAAALGTALLAGGVALLLCAPRLATAGHGARGGALAAAPGAVVLDEESDRQVQMGVCVLDAHRAAFYLARAGTLIRLATLDCPDAWKHWEHGKHGKHGKQERREARLVCAAEVSTVIGSFAWGAAYIAASVNSCGTGRNVGAACAASLAALVAELGEFAFIATSVVRACELEGKRAHPYHQPHYPSHPERRLGLPSGAESGPPSPAEALKLFVEHAAEMKNASRELKKKVKAALLEQHRRKRRRARTAACAVDANLGLNFLARAGLQIYYLNRACPSPDPEHRKACALDVLSVVSSFAWAAQFLSQLAVDCPDVARARAGCAAVVSDFVAVVAALGPIVNGVVEACPAASLAPADAAGEAAVPLGYADFFG